MGRFEIVPGRLKIAVGRCGLLWDRCGSFWVVPGFSNYDHRVENWSSKGVKVRACS